MASPRNYLFRCALSRLGRALPASGWCGPFARFAEFPHLLCLSIASSSSSSDRGEMLSTRKPRQVVRGCGVDLHKRDLMAGERRVRQDFSDAGN
jgi:hypothetical protein